MLNFKQKNILANDGNWKNLVLAHLVRIASLVTFEKPSEIDFGSAHEAIVATGQLDKAQKDAHQKRAVRAMAIMNAPRQFVETAALNMACNVVEELHRRGLTDQANLVLSILIKIVDNNAVSDQEWAVLEQVIYSVMDHAFSAVSGFNAHAFVPTVVAE
jgi:hypothetical protein